MTALQAILTLDNQVCAMFDCGDLPGASNFADGTPLRVNLHPDGTTSLEDALCASVAPLGSIPVEFTLQRQFPDEARDGYPETSLLTEELNHWKLRYEREIEAWIGSLILSKSLGSLVTRN